MEEISRVRGSGNDAKPADDRRYQMSRKLQRRAHEIIPGGAHTYAKGDDQYPVLAPGFLAKGQGCHVWDVDGHEYIEFGLGNRAIGLGHCFERVTNAARKALDIGCNFTRPTPYEIECAEIFLESIPTAEMVKFCKNGSDATSGAMRLARAYTGRERIAICGDHPFFSTDDWFIGTTPVNSGVPEAIKALTLSFRYGDLEDARALFDDHPGEIAAVILEPSRGDDPPTGYLAALRELAHEHGALFVLDEMITGFRWDLHGGQGLYGVKPDLSCFGKAMANGFSVSALCGKRDIMRLGGLEHDDRPRVFLLSTTHGAETHALVAATETMRVYQDEPVIEHLYAMGALLRRETEAAIARRGMGDFVKIVGRDCCLAFQTLDADGASSQAFRSLFLQETIRRGIIAPSLTVSYSHAESDISAAVSAIDGALAIYERALYDGVEKHLIGRPSHVVYRRYNLANKASGLDQPGAQ
ncbi:glutamate-1-semialdehyde 2,1-aminomutase [Qingshengfaniella alkalisoli]|uniref:Glutamate-1-semialdehyde 2,1-aminomutase n=1 Tax=Qingshengfaniella alkalisoli TaxID=2599296 RepID=A0A5B8IYP9_9RHOB|nr:glutamate-1-semialdehyde 2,1-aminomutase [Qingshengfaniella alkalisoli]QDY70703.1 glutamate-1-semialdehyde 2,1-aminomutase [Qingshengfaniella alkalisoli]